MLYHQKNKFCGCVKLTCVADVCNLKVDLLFERVDTDTVRIITLCEQHMFCWTVPKRARNIVILIC
jgi:hypothetical protein